MSYVNSLFEKNFLEYASYVIKDRAIPDLGDGLKPVQRRILHSLFDIDDGKFHKVANVVGHCMKYHPHGDQSIGSALVVLANKDFFIERQGNFGNILTGDSASAARYIECRCTALAKKIFYNPELTEAVPSYDGRNMEPVVFPAKLPVVLATGAEGIAVGMSTKILPHNMLELLEAEKACLSGKKFVIYPDFQCGGLVDVSDYRDGLGKVLVRAKLDVSDPKRIVIRELPHGCTTESLIASVETAARAGRVKIQSITDYTTENVEIEIKLARGVYSQETVDALFAFTECEQSVSVNLLLIKEGLPALMTVTEVIEYHSKQIVKILKKELELESSKLSDRLHQRTLERIFIEERIYKKIEEMKTAETVVAAVIKGFKPFMAEVGPRGVSPEDVERLLKIPIRRISLYDIEKAKAEMREIEARMKEIAKHLKNLVAYAISFLDGIVSDIKKNEELNFGKRRTKICSFKPVDVKEFVKKDLVLRYDESSGYLGTTISGGKELFEVSELDRVLVMRANAEYQINDVPEKIFVGKNLRYVALADKEALPLIVFTIIYRDKKTKVPFIKRFKVEAWIMNRDYTMVPDGAEVLHVDTREKFMFALRYKPKPRCRIDREEFDADEYLVKGAKAGGVRLSTRELDKLEVKVAANSKK